MVGRDRQLHLLLPINNSRVEEKKRAAPSVIVVEKEQNQAKRYIQIKQSLKSKGLIKSGNY